MVYVDELQKHGVYVVDGQSSRINNGIQHRSYLCFFVHASLAHVLMQFVRKYKMHYMMQNAFECISSCPLIVERPIVVSRKVTLFTSTVYRYLSLTDTLLSFPKTYDTYIVLWNSSWSVYVFKTLVRRNDVDTKLLRILQMIQKKLYKNISTV